MENKTHYDKSVLFGTAFYDEYLPDSDLDYDFSLMKEAGFTVIRVGEGSWSKWEPEDGQFNLDWLQPVLDKASEYDIKVIIGMPTFSLPRWMARKYPEIALTEISGMSKKFGFREEHNYSHPTFRFFSQRIIEEIITRYRSHPVVIGWQVYNEPGLYINYSHDVFEGFKDFLRKKYVTVGNLNKKWGLVFWSHELATWDDLWAPEGNGSPQYDYEWRCYQQTLTTQMISWTDAQIRKHTLPHQFTTACIAANRNAVDEVKVCSALDISSANIYYHMQDGFHYEKYSKTPSTAFPSGAYSIALASDRAFAMKQSSFYVFETNGGAIGGAADNYPGFNGQWRQAAFQMISRGATMIEYWHWQSLHYGSETYWTGILPHDRNPGRVYSQIAALGNEISQLNEALRNLTPQHDVVFLYSERSKNALNMQPHRAEDISSPHRQFNDKSYDEILRAFYLGAYQANRQVGFTHDSQIVNDATGEWIIQPADFARENPVLVAVALFCTSESLRKWLADYVRSGGHLMMGPKSLYADEYACPLQLRKPALPDNLAGCYYQEQASLPSSLKVKQNSCLNVTGETYIHDWIECLVTEGAETVAGIDHPHFDQFSVVVTHETAPGRVTTVGSLPDASLAESLFRWAVKETVAIDIDEPGITISSAIKDNNTQIVFIFNWDWAQKRIELPNSYVRVDIQRGTASPSGLLNAWDVQIFRTRE